MSRLILATLLITVVFSWEDIKRSLLGLIKNSRNDSNYSLEGSNVDQLVGAVLILAFTPVNLVYLLIAEGSLYGKFGVIGAQLLLIGALAQLVEIITNRGLKYQQADSVTTGLYLIGGLVSPALHFGGQIIHHHRIFGSFIRHLLFPILFGFVLKYVADKYSIEALQTNLDILIIIAVAGMILSISLQMLERIFRSNHFRLFSYFRIILGLVILLVLGNKII